MLKKIAFDEFVRLNRGFDLPDKDVVLGDYPVVASTNIKAYHNKYKVNPPVIVTGRSGSLGKVQYITEKCWPLNTSLYSKDFRGNDPRYIYYYLQTMHLEQYNAGAGVPTLNQNHLQKLKIQVHDFEQQKAIASILNPYDELINLNNKRIKALEQIAENLYKEWFVRFRFPGHENAEFENGIPKGWEYYQLNSIAQIEMGQSPESKYFNYEGKGLPFHQGVGGYGGLYLVDEVYSSQGKRYAEPNSIIFSVRAPVGRLNISLNRIILGRGVASINSKDKNNWFLFSMLKNRFNSDDMIGNGSIFASVKKEELQKQKFLIPPKKLIDQFDSFGKTIEKQIRTIYYSNNNLIKQRDLLLPRLMSGKLEV